MTRTGAAIVAVGCLLAVCCSGCGSSSDRDGGRDSVDELLDRLPGDTDQLTAVDLALAKRQLGVAADLDTKKQFERQDTNSPEERFDTLANPVFTVFTLPDEVPRYLRAIDLGQVAAAVSARGRSSGGTIMFATPQPIDGLRKAIRAAGLGSLGDDIYFVKNPDAIARHSVVGLRDGLVIVGESTDVISGALHRTRPDPRLARLRRLLKLTRGASRAIRTFKSDERSDEAPCISAIAGGDRLASGEDTDDLVLGIDGEPRPDNVMLGSRTVFGTTRAFRARDAARSGTTLRVSVRAVPNDFSAQGASDLARYAILHGVYRCSPEIFAQAVRTFPTLQHPAPDRSGSALETEISDFMTTRTKSPTGLRVRCDSKTLVPGATTLRCRATRRFRGRVLQYVLQVGFTPARKVRVISVYSADDKTGQIPIAGARAPRGRGASRRRVSLAAVSIAVPDPQVRGMRVALTGSAGFVGSNLVRALLHGGAEAHALVHPESDIWRLGEVIEDVEVHRVDVLDAGALQRTMASIAPDAVVNLATYRRDGTHGDRATALATNVVGVSNLLEATDLLANRRLVHLGTFLESGQTFYGLTKALATQLCRAFAHERSRSVVVLRPYSTYGPWQPPDRLIPAAIVAARDGGQLDLTAGHHRRDWVYVADVVEACLLAIVADGTAGEIIDLGTGRLSTNADVVRAAENATGACVASRPGRHPPRPWDADGAVAPTAKAKAALGWIARHDLEAGVRATAEWMEDRMDLYRARPAQSV